MIEFLMKLGSSLTICVTSEICNLFFFLKGYTLKALSHKAVTSVTFVTSKI